MTKPPAFSVDRHWLERLMRREFPLWQQCSASEIWLKFHNAKIKPSLDPKAASLD